VNRYLNILPTMGLLVLLGCGGGPSPPPTDSVPPPELQPLFALSIFVSGTGAGRVVSNSGEINCSGAGDKCKSDFVNGTSVILTSTATVGSRFIGFGGDPDCFDGAIKISKKITCLATFMSTPTTTSTTTVTTTPKITVSAGYNYTCALLSDSKVKCWGLNDDGQLGNNATSTSLIPAMVSGITNANVISAGIDYTCAVLLGGTVNCWGLNDDGQLGNNATSTSLIPAMVIGITAATVVSAGESHTCAVLLGGTVNCWGLNNDGQLGNATTTNSRTPVVVSGMATATDISIGLSHTCAVLLDGKINCWGLNDDGQLGDGNGAAGKSSSLPVVVSGISTALSVSAGDAHTCAVLAEGAIRCWGAGVSGQLGNGSAGEEGSSVPVSVNGITTAISVSAGSEHTCAQFANGMVSCWGGNGYGQLGNGNASLLNVLIPVNVTGLP